MVLQWYQWSNESSPLFPLLMSHPVLGTPHSTDIDGIIGGGGTGNSKLSYVISFWSVPQISDSFPNKQTNKHVQWIVGAAVPAGTLFNALYKILKYYFYLNFCQTGVGLKILAKSQQKITKFEFDTPTISYTNMNQRTDKHDSQDVLIYSVALSPLKPGHICLRQRP